MSEQRRKHSRDYLGPKVSNQEPLHKYEISFRRWLGRELHMGLLSVQQAAEKFSMGAWTIKRIKDQYVPQVVPLEDMTEAEKHQLEELQKRLKLLEKQLEEATIKNIALETLVDVAEQDFKIPIRKKSGAKQ